MIFYTRILPILLLAAAAFFAIYHFKKFDRPVKIAAIICIFNFLSDVTGNVLGMQHIKNMWWYNGSDFIRYALWFYFFCGVFEKPFQRRMARFFLILFPLTWITVNFFQPITQLQTISFITGGVMLAICCFVFLFNEYQKDTTLNLYKNPLFWISMGLLIYYSLNLPFIGLYNWLRLHSASFTKLYFYICVLGSSFVLSILMIKAFVCSLPKTKYGLL